MEDNEKDIIQEVTNEEYKWGFTTDIDTETIRKGLDEDIVRLISQKKGEPEWMLEFRLKAFRHWQTMKQPTWGHVNIPPIDYQAISYYADPMSGKKKGKKDNPGLDSCASGLITMENVLSESDWTEAKIDDRAKWLYEKAKALWSMDTGNETELSILRTEIN